MSTNATIEDDTREALVFDPRIPDPAEIAILTAGGTVTLRGTVGSFRQRRAAVDDTSKVDGVDEVFDELDVRLLNDSRRDDAEIRGIALQILMWDVDVPEELLDVKVKDGWVTLTGEVSYQFERDAAFDDVALLYGVVGITDKIKVVSP